MIQNTTVPDFSEDPFKDYRYEDPFAIQDPFDDNAGKFSDLLELLLYFSFYFVRTSIYLRIFFFRCICNGSISTEEGIGQ